MQQNHCLIALKLFQSGKNPELMTEKEKYSVKIYMQCQQNLNLENSVFMEFVHHKWDMNKGKQPKIRPSLLKYAQYYWSSKCKYVSLQYPQFYQETSVISMSYDENDGEIDFQHVLNILEMVSKN